ncbi:hypothetical protein JR316_0009295 [Psilocybe cubensis]|uniref:Uncharacterized protein n=2 Tax=Psilocybe cubensis TaxID=181762 RepID=A0A8H8CK67_PSICU|nr:hypothetical protein JR316_0009295 [Psilocybe cubensis]KAH9478833.1 hypothetical protein JR316_0009295 [Psilocybe cubensis]
MQAHTHTTVKKPSTEVYHSILVAYLQSAGVRLEQVVVGVSLRRYDHTVQCWTTGAIPCNLTYVQHLQFLKFDLLHFCLLFCAVVSYRFGWDMDKHYVERALKT